MPNIIEILRELARNAEEREETLHTLAGQLLTKYTRRGFDSTNGRFKVLLRKQRISLESFKKRNNDRAIYPTKLRLKEVVRLLISLSKTIEKNSDAFPLNNEDNWSSLMNDLRGFIEANKRGSTTEKERIGMHLKSRLGMFLDEELEKDEIEKLCKELLQENNQQETWRNDLVLDEDEKVASRNATTIELLMGSVHTEKSRIRELESVSTVSFKKSDIIQAVLAKA